MVILERTFDAGGEIILLEVHKPQADRGDFRCEYEFSGALERSFYGMGVDSMQALQLALCNAHVDLLAYRREVRAPISWLGMRELGLPLADNVTAADFDNTPEQPL